MALCSTDSHCQIRFALGTRVEYYLAYSIKNFKMPSYQSFYEIFKKNIFD